MPTKGLDIPERWVTPEVIRWAREQLHLSVDDAASAIGIEPDLLRAWETGEAWPDLSDLDLLADLYDCPAGYFFLDAPPAIDLPSLDFRRDGAGPRLLGHGC